MTNTPAVTIPMKQVNSSQIHAIGHDPDTSTLAVRFKNKAGEPSTLYHYANVTEAKFAEFATAESIGSYFYKNIKPAALTFPYTKIDESGERGINGPQ